jgi:hypothetical protein
VNAIQPEGCPVPKDASDTGNPLGLAVAKAQANGHNYKFHKLEGRGVWRVHLSGQMVCDMVIDDTNKRVEVIFIGYES